MSQEGFTMQYKINDIVKGQVTGIEDYGIFVKLDKTHIGLIHISEITEGYVNNINNFVKIDEMIFVRILDIDNKTGQMKLSIKNINYKENGLTQNIQESIRGFLPLQQNLSIWTEEKLKEIKD